MKKSEARKYLKVLKSTLAIKKDMQDAQLQILSKVALFVNECTEGPVYDDLQAMGQRAEEARDSLNAEIIQLEMEIERYSQYVPPGYTSSLSPN